LSKYIALIPLRGGSKGIPNKNIKHMMEKPLCYWVLKAAINCSLIAKTVVSTDCPLITEVVKSLDLGVECINRPPELATDTASTEAVMLNFLKQYNFKNLITIQATSPLLTSNDLLNGIMKFENDKLDSMLSAVNLKRFFWSSQSKPLNYNPAARPRRQDFEGQFVENGAFYITNRKVLVEQKNRLGGRIGIFQMPDDTFTEVDEEEDWLQVEMLLRRRLRNTG
jgi:CMP-N-acetylneuraminic acid synthetase